MKELPPLDPLAARAIVEGSVFEQDKTNPSDIIRQSRQSARTYRLKENCPSCAQAFEDRAWHQLTPTQKIERRMEAASLDGGFEDALSQRIQGSPQTFWTLSRQIGFCTETEYNAARDEYCEAWSSRSI